MVSQLLLETTTDTTNLNDTKHSHRACQNCYHYSSSSCFYSYLLQTNFILILALTCTHGTWRVHRQVRARRVEQTGQQFKMQWSFNLPTPERATSCFACVCVFTDTSCHFAFLILIGASAALNFQPQAKLRKPTKLTETLVSWWHVGVSASHLRG